MTGPSRPASSRRPISPLAAELLPRCLFPPPGTPVTCAVSGGADSLALLVLATASGCTVDAVHVDHGLRPGSGQEAHLVEAACQRYGAGFRSVPVAVDPGPNLEARARQARYSVLPPGVLTGHTADDQAETVVLNLLRGSGLDGLGAMAPTGHPLLALRRAETHALCAAEGLEVVADPSNDDPSFRRNRVRHEVLPLLDEVAERDLVPVLVRQAQLLRDEAALLHTLAEVLDPTDAAALREAPVPLARRAVRAWLREGTGQEHPPSSAAVERVLQVARLEVVATEVGAGWSVRRSGGRLLLGPGGRLLLGPGAAADRTAGGPQ